MFDSQVMLLGEITFKSLLGVKGIIQKLHSPNWPSPPLPLLPMYKYELQLQWKTHFFFTILFFEMRYYNTINFSRQKFPSLFWVNKTESFDISISELFNMEIRNDWQVHYKL